MEWWRELSPEVEVVWGGWVTTLSSLHHHKWEIAVEENFMARRYTICIRHKQWDCVGWGEFDHEIMRFLRPTPESSCYGNRPRLQVGMKIGYNIFLMETAPNPAYTRLVDPCPAYEDMSISKVSIKDLRVFRDEDPPIAEHEVFVKEPTVAELLQLALEKQEPDQIRIRNEMLRRKSILKMNVRMVA